MWSSVFTLFFLGILNSQRCFGILHGPIIFWTNGSLVWIWLLFFFRLGNRGRLVLLVCSALLVLIGRPNITSIPAAAVEGAALRELRSLTATVEAFRKEHPQLGYPENLPQVPSKDVSKRYRIEYRTLRSKAEGPNDQFLIEVTPIWRECGFIRSFTAAEDGKIYFTVRDRAATKSDDPIG